MSSKRAATSVLNHENWDNEEKPEEAGTFKTASAEELKTRAIKKARRRIEPESGNSGPENENNKNVFATFAGFKNTEDSAKSPTFSFLSKSTKDNEKSPNSENQTTNLKTETDQENNHNLFASFEGFKGATEEKSSLFSFLHKPKNNEKICDSKNQSGSNNKQNDTVDKNNGILKNLNRQFIKWLSDLNEKNSMLNLTTSFKQYEKSLEKLLNGKQIKNIESTDEEFEFEIEVNNSSDKNNSEDEKLPSNSKERVNVFANIKFPVFSFENNSKTTAGGSAARLFNFSDFKTSNFGKVDTTLEIEQNIEPPKIEFKPIVEEGSIYSKRCKVFVKHDGNYNDRGVGTLYLKPIKDFEKTQLIVRADTSLGNILLNFILSEGLPSQRMGKNNVMIVCIPTPESEKKPTSILIRVKTEEDANELLENIEKYKK